MSIDTINVSYGDIQVLFDLSLHLNEGEVLSIIGANGAGKSTLLKTISGLLQPSSGSISFAEKPIHQAAPETIVEGGLVHVPEGRRLFTLMTVRENLEMGAFTSRAYGRLKESLEEVYEIFPRLRERENQMAGTLSGGEQQMVAIGRGIMARPRVMMFDEPSLGLSPVLRKDIFKTVQMVAERGVTVLLVEQDVNESLGISDRGYVMEQGQVVLEGSGRELLHDPHVKKAYLGI
jgi:branched-chain amino acid transport system ATP-binding protein